MGDETGYLAVGICPQCERVGERVRRSGWVGWSAREIRLGVQLGRNLLVGRIYFGRFVRDEHGCVAR